TTPTLLVHVDGDPVWRKLAGTSFERAINSRALLLRDGRGELFLQAAGYWYRSASAGDAWQVMPTPTRALLDVASRAAAGKAPARPDPMLPPNRRKPARPPAILLATAPAELIVTADAPQIAPVAGVELQAVSNSDHAVLVDPSSNQTYALVSGRWFRAP